MLNIFQEGQFGRGGSDPLGLGYLDPFWPTVLYSMRKRRAAYTGYCIKVRNTSTNTETDVGFDANGWCDASVLNSLISGAQGLAVKTWYDQSGNGLDVTQTTNSQQPLIISTSGGLYTQLDGKPCIRFDDDTKNLGHSTTDAAFGFGTGAWTVEVFLYTDAPQTTHFNNCVDFRPAAGVDKHTCGINSSATHRISWFEGTQRDGTVTSIANTTKYNLVYGSSGSTMKMYVDGVEDYNAATSVDLQASRPVYIGNSATQNGRMSAWFGEVAICKGTQKYTAAFTPRAYS